MTDQARVTAQRIGFFSGPLQTAIAPPTIMWVAFVLVLVGSVIAAGQLVLKVAIASLYASGLGNLLFIAPVVAGVVALALRVYVDFAVLRGYGPARIFLSVVAGLVLIAQFPGFDPLSALGAAAILAAIVIVWLPESNRYFAAVTAARKAPAQLPASDPRMPI